MSTDPVWEAFGPTIEGRRSKRDPELSDPMAGRPSERTPGDDDRLDRRPRPSSRRRGVPREGGAQALGRSRGGSSTKVIVVALEVAEGRRNDAPLANAVLIEARDAVGGFAEVLGDKGLDSDAVRDVVLDVPDALPATPDRNHRKQPWPWDDQLCEVYQQRNRVERAFARAKQFRRCATTYAKPKDVYLGVARSVFGFIHVRKIVRTAGASYPRRAAVLGEA